MRGEFLRNEGAAEQAACGADEGVAKEDFPDASRARDRDDREEVRKDCLPATRPIIGVIDTTTDTVVMMKPARS